MFDAILFAQLPAAGQWRSAAPLPEARQELYPEVLNGRIYVAGGILNPNTRFSNSFDAYDPRRNSWTRLVPLPEARHHITLSAMNGRIYGIGGFSGGFPNWRAQPTMWVYEPVRNRWTRGIDMTGPRAQGVAAVVDGRIYWIGGRFRPRRRGAFQRPCRQRSQRDVRSGDAPLDGARPGADRPQQRRGRRHRRQALCRRRLLATARHGIGMAAVGRRLHVFGGATRPGGNYATATHQVLQLPR